MAWNFFEKVKLLVQEGSNNMLAVLKCIVTVRFSRKFNKLENT